MLKPFLFMMGFFVFIFLVTTPIRKKKNAKNKAILAESGEKLEEIPYKTAPVNGENGYIDVNYVLFYGFPMGIEKYDIKTVKNTEIISQRIQGERSYWLVLKDANGNKVGKDINFPFLKDAENVQAFIQKYIDKIASGI